MKFRIGQVCIFAWDGSIFAKLIRLYNKIKYGKKAGNWTHTGIITGVGANDLLIHEAVSKGFTSSYYSADAIRKDIKKGICLIGETEIAGRKIHLKNVKNHADNYLGRPYSVLDLIAIGFSILGISISLTGAKSIICSEAVARILYDASGKKIDFVKEFGIPYDLIAPIDLKRSTQIRWKNK